MSGWTVYKRGADRERLGEVEPGAFTLNLRHNAVSKWTMSLEAAENPTLRVGDGVVFARDDGVVLSGLVTGYERKRDAGGDRLSLSGVDDLGLVAERLLYPDPARPLSGTGFGVDERYGAAETVISDYVRVNAGPDAPQPYERVALDMAPVGHWRTGESAGSTVAVDASGNGHDGAYEGSPTLGVPGALVGDDDTAMSLPGDRSRVNLGNPAALQIIGDQTIKMWLKPANFSLRRNPWAKAYGGEGTITQETSGRLSYFYGTAGGNASPYQHVDSLAALTVEEWQHVAIVRDLTNMMLYWYIDGVETNAVVADYAEAVASALPALIGDGYTNGYDGGIDEPAVLNRALSPDEVRRDFEAGRGHVRAVPGLQVAASQGRGTTVRGRARARPLVDYLAVLAERGGVGFQAVQDGPNIVFSCYVPADKTDRVRFDADAADSLGNLRSFHYQIKRPTATWAIAGGRGESTDRLFRQDHDNQAVIDWGRIETFLDRNNAGDPTDPAGQEQELDDEIADALRQDALAVDLRLEAVDVEAIQWRRDYDLGDKVRVRIDGEWVAKVVREVEVTVDSGGERVAPSLGDAASGGLLDLFRRLGALEAQSQRRGRA